MDRYEFRDAKSQKFWEVEVAGETLIVRFGRIGTDGQVKTKSLGSCDAAERARTSLVREKTGKGYIAAGHISSPIASDLASCAAEARSEQALTEKISSRKVVPPAAMSEADATPPRSIPDHVEQLTETVAAPTNLPVATHLHDPEDVLASLLERGAALTDVAIADGVAALADTDCAKLLVATLHAYVSLRQSRSPQAALMDRIAAAAAFREPILDKEQAAAVAESLSKLIAITDRVGSHVTGPALFALAGHGWGKISVERVGILTALLRSTETAAKAAMKGLRTDAILLRAGCLALMFARAETPPNPGEPNDNYKFIEACAAAMAPHAKRLFILYYASPLGPDAFNVAGVMLPAWRMADEATAEALIEEFLAALKVTDKHSELLSILFDPRPEAEGVFRCALRALSTWPQLSPDAATAGLVRSLILSRCHFDPDEIAAERAAALIAAGPAPATEAALRDLLVIVRDVVGSGYEREKWNAQKAFGRKWPKRLRPPVRTEVPSTPEAIKSALHSHALLLEKLANPTSDWLARAQQLTRALPDAERVAWFEAARETFRNSVAATRTAAASTADYEPAYGFVLDYERVCGLRAAVYVASGWPAAIYGPLVESIARKDAFVPMAGKGILSEKLGNACLWALINMPDGNGVPYLARLLARVKYPSVKKKIDAALNEAAQKAGITRNELDELSIPTHDLDASGAVEIPIGEGRCELVVIGSREVELRWFGANGKQAASIPAALKPFKAEIKAARDLAKEIEADLGTQVLRLQQMYLAERRWPAATWAQRYLEHPLLSNLTRSLIWNIWTGEKRTAVLWTDGALRDVRGEIVDCTGEVTPWHPVTCPVEEVLAWRARIEGLGIVQPFKQAHREVYLSTDAERRTGTYSNRFAGHIVRQHQLMTLARINGWMVTHRIWADTSNNQPTYIVLPAYNLLAEYWTMPSGGQDDPPIVSSGAFMYLATDRLKFYSLTPEDAALPMTVWGPPRQGEVDIADVPPIVLSEIMRHCDLFVGVASIGNDSEWIDGGAEATHPNQWGRQAVDYARSTAHAELTGAGEVRRQVLETLVPRLAFGDRCKLEERHLRVQGKLRAYKIHLGSGNILMEPNDQYLCIVPKGSHEPGVRLPFEGDSVLSIILSKAALLAADDKIADPSIVSQIIRR